MPQQVYTYKDGMNRDLSKTKTPNTQYYDAENIRIIANDTESSFSLSKEKGNVKKYELPSYSKIIGHSVIANYLVLFSASSDNRDSIVKIDLDTDTMVYLFQGVDLRFDPDSLIETDAFYENESIIKVYWVDGINQKRFINIMNPPSSPKLLDVTPKFTYCQPRLERKSWGGIHTAGMIQYGYNLIKRNGQQTKLSPLTELIPLAKENAGGEVNEIVGQINHISIDVVDTDYDIIRIYAVKYTSYNQTPVINVIHESEINGNTVIKYSDDGYVINPITVEELIFLGGNVTIPKFISSHSNRSIEGNLKEIPFDISTEQYDTRAFRFPRNGTTTQIENSNDGYKYTVVYDPTLGFVINNIANPTYVKADPTHDCINNDFNKYNYKRSSTVFGASGDNVEVSLIEGDKGNGKNKLKTSEIYRIFIEFWDEYGRVTPPKWICDFKTPRYLGSKTTHLQIELKNTSILASLGAVGWRVLRAERTEADRTILTQGILNPTFLQIYNKTAISQIKDQHISGMQGTKVSYIGDIPTFMDDAVKMPSPFLRNRSKAIDTKYFPDVASIEAFITRSYKTPYITHTADGTLINEEPVNESNAPFPDGEIFSARVKADVYKKQLSIQNTKLLNFYSPEVVMHQTNQEFEDSTRLSIVGQLTDFPAEYEEKYGLNGILSVNYDNRAVWGKRFRIDTQALEMELYDDGVLNLYQKSAITEGLVDDIDDEFHQNGKIGGLGNTVNYDKYQYYRKYRMLSTQGPKYYDFKSAPKFVGKGVRNVKINDSSKLTFNNDLKTVVADRQPADGNCKEIISVNTIGNNTLVFTLDPEYRLEHLYVAHEKVVREGNIDLTGELLLTEITRTLANQYGGNTYEARSRNNCIPIGQYVALPTSTITITNPGDVFVSNFSFMRLLPNESEIFNYMYTQITEIVEFPVETTIDLDNRHDLSRNGWGTYFQPTYDEYHKYNRVYSQESIVDKRTTVSFLFKPEESFPTRILASKAKIAGELIDSWADVLLNEELYLDGNYGEITKLIKTNDNILAFQRKAFATLQIAPRVQQVTSDGIGLELGTGSILYNKVYISTESGLNNQLGITSTPNGVYWVDVENSSLNRFTSNGFEGISDKFGFHVYAKNNLSVNDRNSKLITCGYDNITNEVYFTFAGKTMVFSETVNSFTTFLSTSPKRYIKIAGGILTTNDDFSIYREKVGDVGNFYGTVYDSSITFMMVPNPHVASLFTNLNFKCEFYDAAGNDLNVDGASYHVPMKDIKVCNDYQTTGTVPLVYKTNISRRFRDWNLWIPRIENKSLERLRGNWVYTKLSFDNSDNSTLILNDLILTYYA